MFFKLHRESLEAEDGLHGLVEKEVVGVDMLGFQM